MTAVTAGECFVQIKLSRYMSEVNRFWAQQGPWDVTIPNYYMQL